MSESLRRLLEGTTSFDSRPIQRLGLLPFLTLLAVSVVASVFIAFLYLRFYSSRATGSQVYRAFPLLALSITSIFICIQFSLPLSLGLLGALSIVRFRTPIKEAEEIGFIMLVVASSLACATFNLLFLVALLAVALLALAARRLVPHLVEGGARDGSLVVSMPEERYAASSAELVRLLGRLGAASLESITRNDGQVVVSCTFRSLPAGDLVALEAELSRTVEPTHLTILYHRPGAL